MTTQYTDAFDDDTDLRRKYRTDIEQAAYLGVTQKTLYNWRRADQGPPWLAWPNGRILYYRESTEAWLRSCERVPA